MAGWLEFKCIKQDGGRGAKPQIEPLSIRSYSIRSVVKQSSESTTISIEDDNNSYYVVAEPYEEVMKKIHKAEEPASYPVAERFTTVEYKQMLACLLKCKKEESDLAKEGNNAAAESLAKEHADLATKIQQILEEHK